jgi:alkanesulfonate monooxygenase SsuD/methylene tetrahydromethanopterin reductase-like flavin-dependent oxidoreductase (luciferase family)
VDVVLMMARPRQALAKEVARVRAEQGVERISLLIGLVVRETDEQAWAAAAELHPDDRRQRLANKMFMPQVIASEQRANYAFGEQCTVHDERLWYGFPSCGMDAPKLIGSADQVRAWLDDCADLGVTDLIIDLPANPAEYAYLRPVLSTR